MSAERFWSTYLLVLILTTSIFASQASATTNEASSPNPAPPCLQVGIGYPDIRARLNLIGTLDGEIKVAVDDGQQAYAGRLYWSPWKLGPLAVELGAEGGLLEFNGVETLSGSGVYAEPFLGLEYRFARRWMVSADLGPAWIRVSSQGQSLTQMQMVFNTALYFTLF